MSNHFDRFDQNIARVDNLCNLFETVKESKNRPTVKEGDILRAAVVFLHSALENYLRSVIAEWLPKKGDKRAIDGISLPTSESRAEKFMLGALLDFSEQKVSDLISAAVQKHMLRISFNDYTDICSWLKKIEIGLSAFKEQELINNMIKRRHKIVHETDANQKGGQGNHYATSINMQTVKAWENATINLVNEVEKQITMWQV